MSVAGQGFGQKRPPLYHLIKNILKEYPSGQVFKVRRNIVRQMSLLFECI